MSVCQYYLRGYCRYDNRCRMTHQSPQEPHVYNQRGPRHPYRQNRPPFNPDFNHQPHPSGHRNHNPPNTHQPEQSKSKNDITIAWIRENFSDKNKVIDILKEMQSVARSWIKTDRFWRFTSRSLFPGGRALEGWNDFSFEEIQWTYRCMTQAGQEHIYKKQYFDYWENTERQLRKIAQLNIETLKSLKPYIDEYMASSHQPSQALSTDKEMVDINSDITSNIFSQTQTAHQYISNNQHTQEASANNDSDTFDFGEIPSFVPSQQYC